MVASEIMASWWPRLARTGDVQAGPGPTGTSR
jgi:hypothetical protein